MAITTVSQPESLPEDEMIEQCLILIAGVEHFIGNETAIEALGTLLELFWNGLIPPDGWKYLTERTPSWRKIALGCAIYQCNDNLRIATYGGYPSDCYVQEDPNGLAMAATLEGEGNEPSLLFWGINELLCQTARDLANEWGGKK